MKKTLTPINRSGGRSRTGRWFKQALVAAASLCAVVSTQAQISVGVGGAPVNDFSAALPTGAWFTLVGGVGAAGAGTFTTPGDVDAGAQTVAQSTILTAVAGFTGANAANASARHKTDGSYLITQPTTVAAAVLKAVLRNTSGGGISSITVSYDFGVAVTTTSETAPGHRAFYSLTGLANSWTPIPEFSGLNAAGPVSAVLNTGVWADGTDIYLLWLDDNAATNPDGGYTIDNFAVSSVVPANITSITITNNPASISVPERGLASFTVGASGAPQGYHWRSNGVPIPGANSATYTIPSTPFSANNAVYTCIVSNSLGAPVSAGATLTVIGDTTPPNLLSVRASTNGTDLILTFSEPMNTGYTDPGNFLIFETDLGVGAASSPSAAVFNGNVVTLTMSAPLTDGVNYSMQIYDVYDTSLAVDPPNVIEPYGDGTNYLVRRDLLLLDFDGPNNEWKFSTETNLFDTGWETVAYDDTTWLQGPAGIGRDASVNGVTIRTPAYPIADSSATFLRRHFYLPSSAVGVNLSIRHVFEDGAVVYLNGVEAGRFNAPAGALSIASRAPVGAADPTPISASLPLNTAGLVPGDNVIAVVVLQNGATSSDMEFALELVANIGVFASGPPSVVTPPASQTIVEGANVTFSVVANGALPLTYHWLRNGSPIPGAHGPSYSIVGVLPSQAGNYSVIVSNTISTATSANGVLTVTADTTAPAFVSAVGPTNASTVVVTFYDAGGFNLADLQNPANYAISLTAGGGALTISSAVAAASGTNMVVTLTTTTPRLPNQNYTVSTTVKDRSAAQNPVTPASRGIVAHIILFGFNHVWRYDETGSDLGTAWKESAYNDSGWLSGAGFLAFEDSVGPLTLFTNLAGGTGTNVSLKLLNGVGGGLGGTNVTFYFRTTSGPLPFNPSAPGNTVLASSYIDDGAIVYVNGTAAMNYNVTNGSTYTNFATATSTEGAGGIITSNLTGFVQANNVIAVEVHQVNMTSSDVAWGMQLEATVTTFAAAGPTLHIVDNGNGTVTLSWTGSGTLRSSADPATPIASWAVVPGTSPVTTSSVGAPKFFVLTQ